MRLNFTRIFLLLAAVAFCYTSCKKGNLQPLSSAKNLQTDSAAMQIALSFRQSLNGAYGGANINDGIKTPTNFTANHNGPVIQSTDPMCGFIIDSTYSYHRDIPDVATNRYWGHFRFTYTCSSSYLDGYKVDDSVNYRTNNTNVYKLYTINQDFIVKALDNTYKLVSMNGSTGAKTEVGLSNGGPLQITSFVNKYTYDGVIVNFATGIAVMKGTVKFIANYTDPTPQKAVTYTGTIVFPGDGLFAEMTILTTIPPDAGVINDPIKKYKINLVTGEITPEG